jgi:hypothetical protein
MKGQNEYTKGKEELQESSHPNLNKLVQFAEELDDDGSLITVFLSIIEMCFQSE